MDNQLQELFKIEKNKLNAEQLKAVETTEGPVLTIAGPGTGKTQVLAIRVGQLLNQNVGLSPSNILCLTYTDAAAFNMRQRLLTFIGNNAYKVQISTYHTFCSQVIQHHPNYFDELGDREFSPADNLTYFEVMNRFLLNLDVTHPLKKTSGNITNEWGFFKKLFSEMDQERFITSFLHQKINDYIYQIKADTSNKKYFYQKGEKKETPKIALEEEITRKTRLKYAIDEKSNFDTLLKKEGYYTFEQMILFVVDAFKKNQELLLDYQERFQYFLVDEYQDTNNAQNKLLFLLCAYWKDNPNLFVVGDDDQSIFRFQGANTENFFNFRNIYKQHLQEIQLDKNYRSSQGILDSGEAFIQSNQQRLIPNKQLDAKQKEHQSKDNKPHILSFNNTFDEEVGIVERIKLLINSGTNPSNIAILYKKHAHSEDFQKILQQYDIPFELHSSMDILKEVLIEQLVNILNYLSVESRYPNTREDLLYTILHYNFFGISSILLIAIYTKNNNSKKKSLRQIISEASTKVYNEHQPEDIEKLKHLSNKLELLLSKIHNMNVQTFIQEVIYELGILSYAHSSDEKVWFLESLYTFFAFIKNETQKEPFKPFHYFIERIENYKNQKEPIPTYKIVKQEQSVKLMTVYGSKGLEFEYVFLIKTTANNWEKTRKVSNPFRLPENVFEQSIHLDGDGQTIEELRRIFYVAITRAKKKIFISHANYSIQNKPQEMSRFISELVETKTTNMTSFSQVHIEKGPSNEQVTNSLFHLLKPTIIDKVKIKLSDLAFIESKLEKFELSASSLKQYLDCPLGFYYGYILRIPRAPSPEQGYGKSVHLALKKLYPDMRSSYSNRFLSKDEFVEVFQKNLHRHRSFFTESTFEVFLKRGSHRLPLFYNHYIDLFKRERIVQNEYPIHLVIDGIRLSGFLDKLIFNGNLVTIVDYKTGMFSKSTKQTTRFSPPSGKDGNHGGDYWRQGAFYKLLIDYTYLRRPEKKWKTEKVIFQYVEQENDLFYEKEFVYSENQSKQLLETIKNVWKSIQAKDFTIGCNKAGCIWCNFAKTNHIQTSKLEHNKA